MAPSPIPKRPATARGTRPLARRPTGKPHGATEATVAQVGRTTQTDTGHPPAQRQRTGRGVGGGKRPRAARLRLHDIFSSCIPLQFRSTAQRPDYNMADPKLRAGALVLLACWHAGTPGALLDPFGVVCPAQAVGCRQTGKRGPAACTKGSWADCPQQASGLERRVRAGQRARNLTPVREGAPSGPTRTSVDPAQSHRNLQRPSSSTTCCVRATCVRAYLFWQLAAAS